MSSLFVYRRCKKEFILNIGMSLCLVVSTVYANFADELVPLRELEYDNSSDMNTLADYVGSQEEISRTSNCVDEVNTVNMIYNADYYTMSIYSSLHNKDYNKFYYSEIYNENSYRNTSLTTQTRSLIADMYFSNRYLITDDPVKATRR